MKKLCSLFFALLLIITLSTTVFAADVPPLAVTIDSPRSVQGIPGLDGIIKATVTNNTERPVDDVMVYITMTDLVKHMTVNLEDYSANKPVLVGTLQAGERKTVELPIRFVYVDKFWLYTSAVTSTSNLIASSRAIPVEITGNTLVDKQMVQSISFVMPMILIVIATLTLVLYRKRYTVAQK